MLWLRLLGAAAITSLLLRSAVAATAEVAASGTDVATTPTHAIADHGSLLDTSPCADLGFDAAVRNFLGPLSTGDDFVSIYENKRPFHIRRNCSDTFASLKLGDLAQLLPVIETVRNRVAS